MDNITHTLTAISLGHAGLNRKTRFATLALVLGSNLPDVDTAWSFRSGATYLKYHRGVTHSFAGVTVLAIILSFVVYMWGRRAPLQSTTPQLNRIWLFIVCWIATASHLLLDFTNAYGVRPFLPFSQHWYAWDIMPIIDPALLLILLAGWMLPALLRLISEEVGARKPGFRRGAIISLTCMLLLWGLRDRAHHRVLAQLDSHDYGGEAPLRLGAFPSLLNPFQWSGVAETDSGFYILTANALNDDLDLGTSEQFHKPAQSPALQAARRTPTGRAFYDFARFPWPEVIELEDGYEVRVHDLRFADPGSDRRGFEIRITLDKSLRPVSESFHF